MEGVEDARAGDGRKVVVMDYCGLAVMLLFEQISRAETAWGGVGSIASGGEPDGGSAQRSFGIFLKWLSDRSCPVYVIATANIRALPVEFTRKGRFDELYRVYLPTHAERQEIFGIHLRLRKREPAQFDLDALARKTEGYTGADIKEVVQLGLKLAFHAGAELGNDHLLSAIPEIRPLSKTDPESVTEVTKWLDSHTKPAGTGHNPMQPLNGNTLKRRVTV